MRLVCPQNYTDIKVGDVLYAPVKSCHKLAIIRRISPDRFRVRYFKGDPLAYKGGNKYPECKHEVGQYTFSFSWDIKDRYGWWNKFDPHPATKIFQDLPKGKTRKAKAKKPKS